MTPHGLPAPQGVKPHGGAERALLSRKTALKAALARRLAKAKVTDASGLLAEGPKGAPRPRPARVNTLKMTVAEAQAWLQSPPTEDPRHRFTGVAVHSLLPDVLMFPEGTDLHDHPLVADGALILQSVASCMPAHALSPAPGWHCVDCCAAPGNKTTHVAARLKGTGKVMAFDRDRVRLKRLVANAKLGRRGQHRGAGLVLSRGDHLLPQPDGPGGGGEEEDTGAADDRRVQALAEFQKTALRHALRFPALERIVYSTCSVHRQENEEVVAAVLAEATSRGFALADPFPAWKRRGLPLVEGAEKLVRTDPYEDGTDGFFVAVFQRVSSAGHADKSAEGAAEARGPAAPLLGAGAPAAGEAAEEAAEEARRARLAEKRKRKKQRQKEAKKRAATAGGDDA
eukprot:jgi/Tetstr1/450014/TSEL_037061.t1